MDQSDALNLHLTIAETSARFHVKPATLAKWRYLGIGPRFIQFGRVILYPVDELVKFEAANLHSATSVKVKVPMP